MDSPPSFRKRFWNILSIAEENDKVNRHMKRFHF